MTRREAWASAIGVFAAALVVRALAAGTAPFPRPEDTAYYVAVARNLVEGHGLTSDAIWSYGTPPLAFPRPAFEVWLPLPTLLVAGLMAVFGAGFAVAQWMSMLVGSSVAVMAWRLAADVAEERGFGVERARTLALGTGLSAAVFLPLVLHSIEPDSTMLFGALVLGACLLGGRIARDPRGARPTDPRLVALGVLLGLAALTRNEAIWLALAWVIVARRIGARAGGRGTWLRLVAGAAIPAIVAFTPWAIRDWIAFGSPLPGQALTNALSLKGLDIFAWQDTPTLQRYLDAGLGTLIGLRVDGFVHNLVNVLLFLGVPMSAIGILALPWSLPPRATALPMLAWFSAITFVATTLLFPVATTWGTFLHASTAVQVLLLVSALLGLDRLIGAIGRRRGWTRPVAWLGPAIGIAVGGLFTAALLPGFGRDGDAVQARFAALPAALAAAGVPLEPGGAPVITDFPIWLAEETGARAIALPDESPDSVLDLARHFPGTSLVIATDGGDGRWPAIAGTDPTGIRCFQPVPLRASATNAGGGGGSAVADPLAGVHAFRIVCP